MLRFVLFLVFCICVHIVIAQQLKISENPFIYSYSHPSPCFDNYFMTNSQVSFSLYETEMYAENNVQNLKVFGYRDKLVFEAVFDRDGELDWQGQQGMRYFIISKAVKKDDNKMVQIRTFKLKDEIHRIDSIFIDKYSYVNGDTILSYTTRRIKKSYLGKLINEQNQYYNQHYRDMKIREDDLTQMFQVTFDDSKTKKKKFYLDKKFVSDYVDDSLYVYSDLQTDVDMYGQLGRYELDFEAMKKHPFYLLFGKSDFQHYLVEGSDFEEPRWMEESMWCGSSIYHQEHYYDGRVSGSTNLSNGLISELWEDYYPEDPNPKPREEPILDSTDSLGNSTEIDIPIDVEYFVPRLNTPVRSIMYRFSYQYFN